MKIQVVERIQEIIPVVEPEPEVRMIATPDWYEHRHQVVAAQQAERRAQIIENVKNAVLVVTALLLIFGSCALFGGY